MQTVSRHHSSPLKPSRSHAILHADRVSSPTCGMDMQYRCCYCCCIAHVIVCKPVIANVEQWLQLSISGQVLRVSHCAMPTLEHYMQQLCDGTNRNYTRHLFRSKHALASQIADIFRWSSRGLLGKLTERAQTFCLPFIRDGSFHSFTVGDLDSAMTAAFGPEIFQSLTDTSYNTKASNMVRPRSLVPHRIRFHKSPSPTSPPPLKKTRRLAQKNNVPPEVKNWPELVTDDIKLKCMRDYFTNSMWQKHHVCAVCARDRYDVPSTTYQLQEDDTDRKSVV